MLVPKSSSCTRLRAASSSGVRIRSRTVKASDRATMLNLMVGLNGYTLCSGIICEELNGSDYLAIPFEGDEQNQNSDMEIGYITRKNSILSKVGNLYVSSLKKYLEQNTVSVE